MATRLGEVLCRLLLYTSTAQSSQNRGTIEFTTPFFVAPTSMLFCFNDTTIDLPSSGFDIVSFNQGGSIFNESEQVVVSTGGNWRNSQFFARSSSFPLLEPLEYGALQDVLSTDPFYGTSFVNQRYDDIIMDSHGNNIQGLIDFSWPGHSPPNSNCVLITGKWQQNTRYQLEFKMTNPSAPSSELSVPMPALWVVPMTASSISNHLPVFGTATDYHFTVRGSKYGTICPSRSQSASVLGDLWDACAVAASKGLTNGTTPSPEEECLLLIREFLNNAAGDPAVVESFPFYDRPPITVYNLSSWGEPTCATYSNTARASRYGGECISCGTGQPGAGGCVCPADVFRYLIGPVACGPPVSPNGVAGDLSASLAASLCATYTEQREQWRDKVLSSRVVTSLFLEVFANEASLILDWADILDANATFYANYVDDDRYKNSPTRTQGIKPRCNRCEPDGSFENVMFQKNLRVQTYDHHFGAMNLFRFLGYLLDTVAKHPCPVLWDRQDPLRWDYGYYLDFMCKPFPYEIGRGEF